MASIISDVTFKRSEDYNLNKLELEYIKSLDERTVAQIKNAKYLTLRSSSIDLLDEKLQLLFKQKEILSEKLVVLDIWNQGYLTQKQCETLFSVREKLIGVGANLKIKDGAYWEIEDAISATSKLEAVVTQINSATVEENGVKRPLNELEKFLWAYSFVANRKYVANFIDNDIPRYITSIFATGDCVCVGFANILRELCKRLNIECYNNSCQVYDKVNKKEGGHHNNIVILNGTAYYCDACWDCVSDRRPIRTFAKCLTSYEDFKDQRNTRVYNTSAPFCDINSELELFQKNLQQIETMQSFGEEEYNHFLVESEINKYKLMVQKYDYDPKLLFSNKKEYKKEVIHYYTQIIELLNKRKIKKPLSIEDFRSALININLARGLSKEKAIEDAELDIQASVAEASYSYLEGASNCFAQEYYKKLEVENAKN